MKKLVLALILLIALPGFAQKSKLASDLVVARHDKSMVEVIVRYRVAPSAHHRSRISARQGTVKTDLSFIRSLHVSLPASRIAELAKDKDVEYIAPNRKVGSKLYNTAGAVNAQAAWNLNLDGTGVGVAVIDSGINNVADLKASGQATVVASFDTLGGGTADLYGHGTHVAGIIAGGAPEDSGKVLIAQNEPSSTDMPSWVVRTLAPGRTLSGMAPKARLVSLKVLNADGDTVTSAVIAALAQIRAFNADGRQLLIHGVNLSIGCEWYPDEFAAGQSPLCRELDQLVGTGVVAVVSAGNDGAGGTITGGSTDAHGRLSTITDPGNAIHAITVGSTHRYQPHTYGVTYTSSKGPTLDGRLKPDLIAPGERITSAGTGALIAGIVPLQSNDPGIARYVEDSGTSMAAPHVSGAIAAFLSVRDEYMGQPDEVKQLFMENATSLGRHEFFQGAGLLDLMRVLSNV